VFDILCNAKQVCNKTDKISIEEIISLHESVLETSQSIIVCSAAEHPVLEKFLIHLLNLLELYWRNDYLRSPRVEECAASLLGFVHLVRS
jgi:hypothetical protein